MRTDNIFVSKEYFKEATALNIGGITIHESPLFPFKMEDGSICHGCFIPEIDLTEMEPWMPTWEPVPITLEQKLSMMRRGCMPISTF